MTKRIVGVKVIQSPRCLGLGAGPVVPFPATEAERTHAAEQAAKVAVLLRRPSPGQVELFRHLAGSFPQGGYIVTTAQWIGTILKATKGISEADMRALQAFNWEERTISPGELHRELMAFLERK